MSCGITADNPAPETTVSFTRSQVPEDSEEDDIQITLAPYIQSYLAHSGSRVGCCGLCLPVPFERAAHRSWWDPRFDSDILEGQYKRSSFPQIRLRFRYALLYILLVSLSWLLYFLVTGIQGITSSDWPIICGTFAALAATTAAILCLTYSEYYKKVYLPVSVIISIIICFLSLFFVWSTTAIDMTPVGQFALCIEVLLLIYTVIPLPLYVCVAIGGAYSIIFECLTAHLDSGPCWKFEVPEEAAAELSRYDRFGLPIRIVLQLCVHAIGLHILIMTHVRMRGTFMKVGQSLLVRKQLEMEKQLKEKMIQSVMPPKVAAWLLQEGCLGDDEAACGDAHRRGSSGDIRSLFRPFNMDAMHNVSVLFADIVGFTRMSSNKSAEELVQILNDLFERFDELCEINGCEKISTLGDCYYCVSGCPEPRPDHAKCCVEMGLGMIEAIRQFDAETHEGVNMRVGIHTGTVLCGIVGTKRFKFDVWSNDVTLANRMESTGKPGKVHISEKTRNFLGDMYVLEEGESVHDMKTFFILGRQGENILQNPEEKPRASSASNSSTSTKVVSLPSPPLPVHQSLPVSPVPSSSPPPVHTAESVHSYYQRRDRVYSCHITRPTKLSPYLALAPLETKASSLPSLLDSDVECEAESLEPRKASTRFSVHRPRRSLKKSPIRSPPKISLEHSAKNQNPVGGGEASYLIGGAHLDVPNEEQLTRCYSVSSRKDSGIRSNSRRSSIQQQLFVMNGITQGDLLTHRVSGYYTSSQSSLDNESLNGNLAHLPSGDHLGHCFHQLRKQSDLQLIRCVQDNVKSNRSYFVKPPLSSITLFFRQLEMEREYRDTAHRISDKHGDSPPTLATSRFNTYFDIFISALVYSAIAMSLFFLYAASPMWIAVFVTATVIQIFAVFLCGLLLWIPLGSDDSRSSQSGEHVSTGSHFLFLCKSLVDKFSGWYPWHVCGAILVSLPATSVLANFSCPSLALGNGTLGNEETAGVSAILELSHDYYFSYVLFLSIVHFCNFTQLNCWMKSFLATLTGVIFISLLASQVCSSIAVNDPIVPQPLRAISFSAGANLDTNELYGSVAIPFITAKAKLSLNERSTPGGTNSRFSLEDFEEGHKREPRAVVTECSPNYLPKANFHQAEIYLDVILLLLLVWFLNREFEISYRLSFHGNAVAVRDKAKVQSMKDQADWLLHNIIPRHVADQLKNTAKYSENHHLVGIIFASIVNFNEMYDESYLGGKEYLRVLNELIADFDELLSRPEFCNVTKIKTIGSTYMAASGLNPHFRSKNRFEHEHLFQLIDFAGALQGVINNFNRDLLGFNFILRVGYNHGDITAGVIGTRKLYYDIWGDAVNIASRMDSTGVPGRIQVGEDCLEILNKRYDFERRGVVYVKGKDNMNVYLLSGKRDISMEVSDS